MKTKTSSFKKKHTNVILHLRCHTQQLEDMIHQNNNLNKPHEIVYTPTIVENVKPIDESNTLNQYTYITTQQEQPINHYKQNIIEHKNNEEEQDIIFENYKKLRNHIHASLHTKLTMIQKEMNMNDMNNTKSACFWDTYPFEGPTVLIPLNSNKGVGCFCSPECAAAYLMNDNSIDDTIRWERYTLLNNIYKGCYKGTYIKPAPRPQYILKRFLGKLTIDEYREMNRLNTLWLIVDKPLTRILPELHQEKEEQEKSSKFRLYRNKPLKKKTSIWSNLISSSV